MPSPAAVIAIVALVFAVSGVAVALPGKNSVATKDIKKNAVTAAKIKNGSVTEAKLGDGAVTTSKIGNDAVTGAKVNEATLGKVPSATSAETATKATSAEKATTAENAVELEGRTLSQVRPIAVGTKDESAQGLDDLSFENVMGVNITLPTGGADVVLNAALELDNESGGQAGGACRLKFNGSVVSSLVNITMTDEHNYALALTAIDANAGAGTRQALVECQGSIGDDDVKFVNGDLTVTAYPIGS
ncbi:MAG TPA: hypothetical protein VFB52_00890 [Solirubrobacterales bacterium]|nr:hypothetical protein [Solirubrobacterales bacterium]